MRSTDLPTFVPSLLVALTLAAPGWSLAQPVAGSAQPVAGSAQPALPLIDVPYLSQPEALCGGAAAAMVLRFWGEPGSTPESFAHLVDRSAAGIPTAALIGELRRRGWNATGIAGSAAWLDAELARGRPVIALIEDRPGTYHYVVVVGGAPSAVIYHDPAQAPFRTASREEFDRRWAQAGRWMSVVLPQVTGQGAEVTGEVKGAGAAPEYDSCARRVTAAVEAAQSSDPERAEGLLVGGLSCNGAARELAGIRLLQQRWPDVVTLATIATTEDPADAHAWRLLGTGLFVQNQPSRALAAWNRAGEPRVDRVSVLGLERTRHRTVERYLSLTPGGIVTPETIALAARRLEELPATTATRVAYVPQGGVAEIRATVVERPAYPTGRWSYAGLAARAAVGRELEVPFGSVTGGGERIAASWRFWPERPRYAASIAAPAPWGGLWSVDGFVERQPFAEWLAPAERSSAGLTLSNWVAPRLWLAVRGGLDRWHARGAFGSARVDARFLSLDERVELRGRATTFGGARPFSATGLTLAARSGGRRAPRVAIGRMGVGHVTAQAPADLWLGGDTGHARDVLLRAHPLLDDGRLRADRLGRVIWHASGEAQQWWPAPAGVRLGAAAFVDAARISRRLGGGVRADVDAGVGFRASLPAMPGVFRVDLGKGLRDGATALSFVFDVSFP